LEIKNFIPIQFIEDVLRSLRLKRVRMKAFFIKRIGKVEVVPLALLNVPVPEISEDEVLIKVLACGVCHTELDEIEGRKIPKIPVVPGHEIIGRIIRMGRNVKKFRIGDRVGVAWINSACGKCKFCKEGLENLCNEFKATGCDVNGGYAEFTKAKENFAYKIPDIFTDEEAAPLLCAGAVGFRSIKLAEIKDGETVALFGFGGSNHIVFQVVRYLYPHSKIFVFTRRKNDEPYNLALKMKADWVGETGETPPQKCNKAIDTTPKGEVVIEALKILEKGGRVVINAIRKETKIPEINYDTLLWEEREIKSVANVTSSDVEEFLNIAKEIPIKPEIVRFSFEEANKALVMLKKRKNQRRSSFKNKLIYISIG